jgi:hypothetical protein
VAEDARLVARRIVEEVLAARQRADGAADAGAAAENGASEADAAGTGATNRAPVDPRGQWDAAPGPAVADELDERPSRAVARRIVEEVLAAHAAAEREVQLPAPAAEAAGPPPGPEAVPLQPVPDRPAVVPGVAAAALGPDVELDPGPAAVADDAASIARRIVENVLAEAAVREAEAREVAAREAEAREAEAREVAAREAEAREAAAREAEAREAAATRRATAREGSARDTSELGAAPNAVAARAAQASALDAREVAREAEAREAEAHRVAARVAAARAAAAPVAERGDRPADAGRTDADVPEDADHGPEARAAAGTGGAVAAPSAAPTPGGAEGADAHLVASDDRDGPEPDLELVREAEVREAQLRDAVLREAEAREARLREARLRSDDGPPPIPAAAAGPPVVTPDPVGAAGAVESHGAGDADAEAHHAVGAPAGAADAVEVHGDVDDVDSGGPDAVGTHGDVDAADEDAEDEEADDEDADVTAPIFAPHATEATAALPAVDGDGQPDDEAGAIAAPPADPARPASAYTSDPQGRGRASRNQRTWGDGTPVGDEDTGGVATLSSRSAADAEATTAVPMASPPAKRAHWLIVSIIGAIGLAVLLPLAIGALRSLVSLS